MANHILIGIGGTGYNVLREFRKRMWEEYPVKADRDKLPVRFLYIDSDEDMIPERLAGREELRVNGHDSAITKAEYFGIKNVNLNAVFDSPGSYPKLKHVFQNAQFTRSCMGEVGKAAGQKRRAGRMLFAYNASSFNEKVEKLVKDLQNTTGDASQLSIYVFAGLAGGTGSGSVVDATSQLIVKYPNAKVEVFAMLPEELIPDKVTERPRYHANGYAALSELSALNARAFFPSNVATGEEHIPDDPNNSLKRFGISVYTNINRNGKVLDSFTELPKIVADVMYFRVFNEDTPALDTLNKYFQSENGNDGLVEYKTNTKPGKPVEAARTKAIGSFGIKRLRYPSERLTSHVSENVARTAMGMMLYLNYDNDRGFVNEEPAQGRDYGEYLNAANLKNWKLHDSDLSLSTPILTPANGKTVPSFSDFWENEVALDYTYKAAKEMGQPLQIVEQYFDERYKEEFREEKGVEAYFLAKSNHDVVKASADAIVNKIAENLFTQWQQGTYSANDVKHITEKILQLLQAKRDGIDGEITAVDKEIADCGAERKLIFDEYQGTGWIVNVLRRSKETLFVEYAKVLAAEYVARTRRVSLQVFQKALLPTLIQKFMDLQSDIVKFAGRLDESIKEYGILIGIDTPEKVPDITKAMIEVADLDRLDRFERDLLRDRNKMNAMAQALRNYFAESAGKSFTKLSERINTPAKLAVAADKALDGLVQGYHAEMMRNKPVLGLNVLDQLYEMYGNSEDRLRQFAGSLVKNSEVYLSLDPMELNRNMPNTTLTSPHSILLVAMPKFETEDKEKEAFVENLKSMLKSEYNSGLFEFYTSKRDDEITLVSYQNKLPARAISYLGLLKKEYEKLVDGPDKTSSIANRIMLHSEGDGTELPPLFGEGEGPKGDEVVKYLFLAAALGILKPGEDEFGRKGWGTSVADDFGIETFTLVSPTFTGILTANDFTPELKDYIVETVDTKMKEQRHVNANKEANDTIIGIVKNSVFPEAGSPTSPLYKKYAEQAKSAMNLFK